MSDSSSETEPSPLNYDNCIVTHNEDSHDSSGLSLLYPLDHEVDISTWTKVDPPISTLCREDEVTCADVTDNYLNAEDSFAFILGTLERIDEYLNNFRKGYHRNWLQHKVALVKTALIKNCDLFRIDNMSNTSETVYDENKLNKQNKKKKKVFVKKSPKVKKPLRKQLTVLDDNLNLQNSVNEPKTNLRRSHRVEDKEITYCDRLTYTSLKLPSGSSTPLPKVDQESAPKRKSRNSIKTSVNQKKTSNSTEQIENKDKKSQINKRRAKSLGMESIEKAKNAASTSKVLDKKNQSTKLKVNNRKGRSLGMESHKNVEKKRITPEESAKGKKEKAKKRRAASLDGGLAKKAKRNTRQNNELVHHQSDVNHGNSPLSVTSSVGKRKLYSEETWLNSLTMLSLESSLKI